MVVQNEWSSVVAALVVVNFIEGVCANEYLWLLGSQ